MLHHLNREFPRKEKSEIRKKKNLLKEFNRELITLQKHHPVFHDMLEA